MYRYLCRWHRCLCAMPTFLCLIHRFLFKRHNFLYGVHRLLCHVHRFLCKKSGNVHIIINLGKKEMEFKKKLFHILNPWNVLEFWFRFANEDSALYQKRANISCVGYTENCAQGTGFWITYTEFRIAHTGRTGDQPDPQRGYGPEDDQEEGEGRRHGDQPYWQEWKTDCHVKSCVPGGRDDPHKERHWGKLGVDQRFPERA